MKKLIFSIFLAFTAFSAFAQCTFKNTALVDGETISYNLYYNWQFVWVKVGTGSLTTTKTTYKGKKAFKSSLLTRGNGKLDKVFVLRDTLLTYSTLDLAPLYYRKGAEEGNYYTVDEATYSYPDGKCEAKLHRRKNDGTHVYATKTQENCIFDMLNIFQRARSFNPEGWKKGHMVHFDITDGTKLLKAKLKYYNKETIKGDNKIKYRCLKLSYIETDKKGKDHEIACLYVTDDEKHIPVRIDMNLRFGSAKAFLKSIKR